MQEIHVLFCFLGAETFLGSFHNITSVTSFSRQQITLSFTLHVAKVLSVFQTSSHFLSRVQVAASCSRLIHQIILHFHVMLNSRTGCRDSSKPFGGEKASGFPLRNVWIYRNLGSLRKSARRQNAVKATQIKVNLAVHAHVYNRMFAAY